MTVKTLTGEPAGPYDPVNTVPCRNVGGEKYFSKHCTHFNKCLLLLDLQTALNFSLFLSFTQWLNTVVLGRDRKRGAAVLLTDQHWSGDVLLMFYHFN